VRAAAVVEAHDRAKGTPRSTGDTAAKMHELSCLGDASYADAVFACWDATGCPALATCVQARLTARH
jgi:hypothetical protein